MSLSKIPIKTIQIVSIAIVLLFVVLSWFDCINVYKQSTGHSQTAILSQEDIKGPTVHDSSYNNEFFYVTIIGVIEVILIIVMCFKLSIVAAIFELLISIGTLCAGYIEGLLAEISGGVGAPLYTVTFEITIVGYFVLLLAAANLGMTILLQVNKKSVLKGESKNAINSNTDWSGST